MQALKFCQRLGIQLPQHFLIIEPRIIAAVLRDTTNVSPLQLFKHVLYIEGGHLGAIVADNWAEVQELSKLDTI